MLTNLKIFVDNRHTLCYNTTILTKESDFSAQICKSLERYPRGRRDVPAKDAVRETVARVRIPPSPPIKNSTLFATLQRCVFHFLSKFCGVKMHKNTKMCKLLILGIDFGSNL